MTTDPHSAEAIAFLPPRAADLSRRAPALRYSTAEGPAATDRPPTDATKTPSGERTPPEPSEDGYCG